MFSEVVVSFFLGLCRTRFLNVFSIPGVAKVLSLAFSDHPLHIQKINSSCESTDDMLVLCTRMVMRTLTREIFHQRKAEYFLYALLIFQEFFVLHREIHIS